MTPERSNSGLYRSSISPPAERDAANILCRMVQLLLCALIVAFSCSTAAAPQATSSADRNDLIAHLPTETRYVLRVIQYLLTPDEFNELISLQHDYRIRRWIEEYWLSKDPVYTTAENEALIEHERRIAFAEEHFGIPKWPMWDHRGELYISFDQVRITLGTGNLWIGTFMLEVSVTDLNSGQTAACTVHFDMIE